MTGCDGVRADVWLWAARFFKTRRLSHEAIAAGKVEIAGVCCKPARILRGGERMRIQRAGEVFEVDVVAVSPQRGPAAVAQALYRESAASIQARASARLRMLAERAGYRPPAKRPDKRARRLIRALGDFDAS